jgi:hypothetical protein
MPKKLRYENKDWTVQSILAPSIAWRSSLSLRHVTVSGLKWRRCEASSFTPQGSTYKEVRKTMRLLKLGTHTCAAIAVFCTLPVCTAAFAEGATPFSQLAGSWHGGGQVKYNDGSNERLSCRGTYNQRSGGTELTLAIRCQSPTNKIDMKSSISYEGGRLSGHWSERNFGLEGDIDGSSASNKLSVRISGQLQGSMIVSVSGANHHVSISTAGPGFKSVSITFSRG